MIEPAGEPPLFDPDLHPVRNFRATLPVTVGPDGAPVLPGVALWAFSLNPGELLAVQPRERDTVCFSFTSYGRRVRSACGLGGDPWPYIRALQLLPLAAVGPGGRLALPDEAAGLVLQPGDRLILRAYEGIPEFSLERPAGRLPEWKLRLEAWYRLAVEPGPQVTLPAEVLWALSLSEGDLLAFQTWMLAADFQRADFALAQETGKTVPEAGKLLAALQRGGAFNLEGLLGRPVARVGAGGTIRVPARVLDTAPLQAPQELILTVGSGGAGFHLRAFPER